MTKRESKPSGLGGFEVLLTKSGDLIRLERGSRSLEIVVEGPHGDVVARTSIPMPGAGYGGHEFLLSGDEHFLALWLYSGQSEVGYEVFENRGSLRRVASFPYVFGEGYGPAFSSDGRRIGLAWATNPGLELGEDVELDDDGLALEASVVEWSRVRVQVFPDGEIESCVIRLRLPPGSPCERDGVHYPQAIAFTDDALHVRTAWGVEIRLPSPLPEAVTIDGPESD